ncbi:MAG: DNA repair protein RecO [Eubacterium sp.]|nr:DNA repair protein RecO [Eubacterium sp.]
MALVKTRALVIRERPFQEQDKIITLFTEQEGKVQAIAKGVRRNKSALVAATQLFSYSEFVYYPGKNFANINQASLIEAFYPLRQDLMKMSLASYILELLDVFYDYYQGNKAVLKLVNYILYYISEKKSLSDEALAAALQLKLTEVNGIRPLLGACSACGAKQQLNYFSIENHGVLCENCRGQEGYTYRINDVVREAMVELMVTPIREIRFKDYDPQVTRKIMDIMDHYIGEHLGKSLKTYDFYKQLQM